MGVTVTKQFSLPPSERASLQAQLRVIDAIGVYLVRVHATVWTPSPMTAQVRPLLVHRAARRAQPFPGTAIGRHHGLRPFLFHLGAVLVLGSTQTK
jgi:hypothetical protein